MAEKHVRIHLVWAHPRADSLTARIVDDIRTEFSRGGATVDELDLYRAGFDPALTEVDEPDWDATNHEYSETVMTLAARASRADAVVLVFPVWWYSMPAILKGYIDRVWNFGLLYGAGRDSGIAAARWIGLAGESSASFAARGYGAMIAQHLDRGIAEFCGIGDSRTILLHDTLGEGVDDLSAHIAGIRADARSAAAELLDALP